MGLPFGPVAERFERLEETLQLAHRMWSGDDSPYAGRHYRLDRPVDSPRPAVRPVRLGRQHVCVITKGPWTADAVRTVGAAARQ